MDAPNDIWGRGPESGIDRIGESRQRCVAEIGYGALDGREYPRGAIAGQLVRLTPAEQVDRDRAEFRIQPPPSPGSCQRSGHPRRDIWRGVAGAETRGVVLVPVARPGRSLQPVWFQSMHRHGDSLVQVVQPPECGRVPCTFSPKLVNAT